MSSTAVDCSRVAYKPIGAARLLFLCRDKFVVCEGPARTGKSRAALEKTLLFGMKYPGARILLCRKTRRTLAESTLQLFEDAVAPLGTPWVFNQTRGARAKYVLPNGSELVIAGLDDPEKIKSSEYDLILVDEATELELEDFEILSSRLSGRAAPYRQMLLCCNPGAPSHWIKKHIDAGEFKDIKFAFSDNPVLNQDVIDTLSRLTGHRRARLFEGIWSAAEGLVFDLEPCVIPHAEPPEGDVFGGYDFGWSNPMAMVVARLYKDESGRDVLYVHDAFEKASVPQVEAAARMLAMAGPECTWYCDPSNPAGIRELCKHGVHATKANNGVFFGIDTVNSLIVQGRLFVSSRCERLLQCVNAYVYSPDGMRPVKMDDHLADALRYLVASVVDKGMMETSDEFEAAAAAG